MKTNKFFLAFLLATSTAGLFTSCDPADEQQTNPEISTGLFILNQGQYGYNNASLTYYGFSDSTATADAFTAKNNRGLGDSGQDIIKYGSRIYICVYKSSLIEVIDAQTGISQKSIVMLNESGNPSLPRSLASYNGKVYVSLYDGHVAQIDTITLSVEKTIAVGSNPEGMAIANNKLYVANSGGMASVKDSTVSVINLSTFTEEKKIKVVINPTVVHADSEGDVYVLSMGNYYDIPYTLQRIEAGTGKVTAINDVKAYNFTIAGDYAYIYYFGYDDSWAIVDKTYTVYDVKNEKISKSGFIASDAVERIPFSIDVDPISKDIYIGETDYVNAGKMYCFDQDGKLKYTFPTGVNPLKTIFITNK